MNATQIGLEPLIPHFPWTAMYEDLGYQMPFPEVLMTSDRAYALSTQVNGLLMMQSWELDNYLTYELTKVADVTHLAYRLSVSVSLGALDEAWLAIGIPEDRLKGYLSLALANYLAENELAGGFKVASLPDGVYMLIATEV